MDRLGPNSAAIWNSNNPEQWQDWDVMPPISATSIYKQVGPGVFKRFDYSRFGNPTRAALESAIAQLENGKHGLVFSSGSAAFVTAAHLLNAGDHIVSVDDLYCGTMVYFTQILNRMNINTTYVDATDPTNVLDALRVNTRMIWLETVSNPKLKVIDLKEIIQKVRRVNPEILIVVDNTFLTPCFLRPLDLGADISLLSCSKYINGHCDVIMGSLTTNRKDLHERLHFLQKTMGALSTAQDCYQVVRSLKTLPMRMERHCQNSLAVAKFLESHPRIVYVNHPLLASHEQHKIALAQNKGKHSGMVSCMLSGTPANAEKLMTSFKMILLAVSLGGVMTTIAAPGSMTADELEDKFISSRQLVPNFLRISVGLEDVEDIIADFKQALDKAFA